MNKRMPVMVSHPYNGCKQLLLLRPDCEILDLMILLASEFYDANVQQLHQPAFVHFDLPFFDRKVNLDIFTGLDSRDGREERKCRLDFRVKRDMMHIGVVDPYDQNLPLLVHWYGLPMQMPLGYLIVQMSVWHRDPRKKGHQPLTFEMMMPFGERNWLLETIHVGIDTTSIPSTNDVLCSFEPQSEDEWQDHINRNITLKIEANKDIFVSVPFDITVGALKSIIADKMAIKSVKHLVLVVGQQKWSDDENKKRINLLGVVDGTLIRTQSLCPGGVKGFVRSLHSSKKNKKDIFKKKSMELSNEVLAMKYECEALRACQSVCEYLHNYKQPPAALFGEAISKMGKEQLERMNHIMTSSSEGSTEARLESICEIVLGKVLNPLQNHIAESEKVLNAIKALFINHYTEWTYEKGQYKNEKFKKMITSRLSALSEDEEMPDVGLVKALDKAKIE